jgi:hypothetical protein
MDDLVSKLHIREMTTDQKIKMPQIRTPVLTSKLKHVSGGKQSKKTFLYLLILSPEMKLGRIRKLKDDN